MHCGEACAGEGIVVTCHHASVRVPRSFNGSLGSLVTLPGCKQLVTRASALLVNMEECMVHAGMKSGTWNSSCIFIFYFMVRI